MREFPNMKPKTFTLSAFIVGYLLLDDLSANEENALGNWLMLVAQVLCTSGAYKQYFEGKRKQLTDEEIIGMLNKLSNAINIEINNLKN